MAPASLPCACIDGTFNEIKEKGERRLTLFCAKKTRGMAAAGRTMKGNAAESTIPARDVQLPLWGSEGGKMVKTRKSPSAWLREHQNRRTRLSQGASVIVPLCRMRSSTVSSASMLESSTCFTG